jgi:hypothetical protein
MNSVDKYFLLQSDIERIQGALRISLKLISNKTRGISFTIKTNVLYYAYKLWDSSITRTDPIVDLRLLIYSKFIFHAHVDYVFSQSVRMLGLTRAVTDSFSTLGILLILYLTLVRPELECASTVWNSIKFADVRKLESIQRKFLIQCQYSFFTYDHDIYEDFNKFLNLHTLHSRRLP